VEAIRRLPQASSVSVHLLWAVVAVAVVLLARRRLGPEHLALVLATVAVGLTANRLGSFERYVGSAIPLVLAAGVVTARRGARWLLAGSSAAALVLYTALAFGGSATP
jgi:hypothetical protein